MELAGIEQSAEAREEYLGRLVPCKEDSQCGRSLQSQWRTRGTLCQGGYRRRAEGPLLLFRGRYSSLTWLEKKQAVDFRVFSFFMKE